MIRFPKLVRDRIPEIIAGNGKLCDVRVLDEAEYGECLEEKLAEEMIEYRTSGELEELADIVELVQAIAAIKGMTWQEFETMRHKKRTERGGFEERLFLISVSD